jgi:glutathione synthase/RimK-type ligase-like ATP-grasp enzyme
MFFDQRDLLNAVVTLKVADRVEGTLQLGARLLDLANISAVYMRLYDLDQLPGLRDLPRDGPTLAHAHAVIDALTTWTELAPILVVNRTSAMASNGSKPYQARLIRAYGFAVPETIITTDEAAVRRFQDRHGTIIYKSISGVRSIVARLTSAHDERLSRLHWCPTQFQQHIPGDDYRVHVVGHDIFACRITSGADDYRYARYMGAATEITPHQLPPEVAARCRATAFGLGLEVSGLDLRQHPDGSWYCFEVNPSPAFTYFQDATGQPIDMAIAQLLASGRSRARM